MSDHLQIYTDGSCSPNPGPGGWAAILLFPGAEKAVELHGCEENTTNNRMELIGAVKGLDALVEPSQVEVYTDSRYLKDGVTRWLKGWQSKGWTTIDGRGVKNQDLWEQLAGSLERHQVTWNWIQGHGDNRWNNRADELAVLARKKLGVSATPDRDAVHLYPGVTWKNSDKNGSWAVILYYKDRYRVLGGSVQDTTANRLYLQAVINGVDAMKRIMPICVHTKSGYLRDGLEMWLDGWQKGGWSTREGNLISNVKEWQELYSRKGRFNIRVVFESEDSMPCLMQEAKELAREFAVTV